MAKKTTAAERIAKADLKRKAAAEEAKLRAQGKKANAVKRLVNGFSSIPQSWAHLAAKHLDKDECVAQPMWGTYFRVQDSCDRRRIEEMLVDPFEVEAAKAELADTGESDVGEIARKLLEDGLESGSEEAELVSSGWRAVSDTGIWAREFDGNLLLGIHGCGYDFFESHWTPLYNALGYGWYK